MAVERPKKSMIYTRTGDSGNSSLYNGEKRRKDDAIFDALGSVDELNSNLGLAQEYVKASHVLKFPNFIDIIPEIQSRLLDIGSSIATPRLDSTSQRKLVKTTFAKENIEKIEEYIDRLDAELPTLTAFILPGGGLMSAQLHVCRSICRRAERDIVHVESLNETSIQSEVIQYVNRLSDLFFVMARYCAFSSAQPETIYKPYQSKVSKS